MPVAEVCSVAIVASQGIAKKVVVLDRTDIVVVEDATATYHTAQAWRKRVMGPAFLVHNMTGNVRRISCLCYGQRPRGSLLIAQVNVQR